MTTNHRPTLESKRGKAESISNTIFHSRSLPQHTSLKYRSDIRKPTIDSKIGKRAIEELKKDLLINESKFDDITNDINPLEEGQSVNGSIDSRVSEESNIEEISDGEISINQETYSSSDDDSADETVQLMEELAKIKKEREEEKKKKELQNKIDKTKISNPLVQVSDTKDTKDDFKIKKNWRNNTAFKNQNTRAKNDDESFTNDTLGSDFHQEFLSKYIR